MAVEYFRNVIPDHPVRSQVGSAGLAIEAPCDFIRGLHVNTHTARVVGDEPLGQSVQQLLGYAATLVLRANRNPLQLSAATKTAREMSRDESDDAFAVGTNEGDSGF